MYPNVLGFVFIVELHLIEALVDPIGSEKSFVAADFSHASTLEHHDAIRSLLEGADRDDISILDDTVEANYADHNPPPFQGPAGGIEGARDAFTAATKIFSLPMGFTSASIKCSSTMKTKHKASAYMLLLQQARERCES